MQTMVREGRSQDTKVRAASKATTPDGTHTPAREFRRLCQFCSRHRVAVALAALLALLVMASGIFAIACWFRIQRVSVDFPGSAPGGTTYLLVGNDSRSFVQSASDRMLFGSQAIFPGQHANVVILVRIRANGAPEVLSVPRDLLVRLPDGAPARLTQSFDLGAQTLVGTVCHSLGIGVSHLVVLQMNGLRSLVDDVGGITVTIPTPERDLVSGLSLPHAGRVYLNGGEALAYVRARHLQLLKDGRWVSASTALDERSGRAREVLALIGAKLAIGPTNPFGSAGLIWDLSGLITVDSGMSPFDMDQIGNALKQLQGLPTEQLPVLLHGGSVPTAELEAGGTGELKQFGSGSGGTCSANLPIVPASERPSSTDTSSGG
jgi:LCP family protein required for cell wall assembly